MWHTIYISFIPSRFLCKWVHFNTANTHSLMVIRLYMHIWLQRGCQLCPIGDRYNANWGKCPSIVITKFTMPLLLHNSPSLLFGSVCPIWTRWIICPIFPITLFLWEWTSILFPPPPSHLHALPLLSICCLLHFICREQVGIIKICYVLKNTDPIYLKFHFVQ